MKSRNKALYIRLRTSLSRYSLRSQQPKQPKFVGKTKVQRYKGQN